MKTTITTILLATATASAGGLAVGEQNADRKSVV